MSTEITFPLEFIVHGTPVSLQVKRATTRAAWKALVRQASYSALPDNHFATESLVTVTLLYFSDGRMQGDIDNIVKPILDALGQHIYIDDAQVERIWVQKFELGRGFSLRNPSTVLVAALEGRRPFLYIRLGDDPTEGVP